MKNRIKERLKELYEELGRISDPKFVWIKQSHGSKNQRIEECKILIEELEWLLNPDIK